MFTTKTADEIFSPNNWTPTLALLRRTLTPIQLTWHEREHYSAMKRGEKNISKEHK